MCDKSEYVINWEIKNANLYLHTNSVVVSPLFSIEGIGIKLYFNVLFSKVDVKLQLKCHNGITSTPYLIDGIMIAFLNKDYSSRETISKAEIARNILAEICFGDRDRLKMSLDLCLKISCIVNYSADVKGKEICTSLNKVYSATLLNFLRASKARSFQKLQESLKWMLSNDCHNDVKLKVENEEIPAHMGLLSARSPVFRLMFQQNMSETNTGVVHIPDIDVKTMKSFLGYLYTGELDDMDSDTSLNLIFAAHKYQIESLVEVCVLYLLEDLTVKNICRVLSVANLIGDESLKETAINYMKKNSTEVFSSEEWRELVRKNFDLTVYVMDKFSKHLASN